MSRKLFPFAVILAVFLGAAFAPGQSEDPKARELVRKIDDLYRSDSSYARIEMEIVTPDWRRTLALKGWTQGQSKTLIRILEPKKEAGIGTLRLGNEMWNYLPKTDKVIKIPPSMMMSSWMGSDFTNDDLVRGSSLVEDYEAKVLGVEKAGEREVWRIGLTPKPDSPVVWGKVEMLVDRQSCLPVKQVFFDEEGKEARRLEYGDFRQVGWRQFPARMTFIPSDENRQTSILYDQIEFDLDISDDTFGLHRLRQGR